MFPKKPQLQANGTYNGEELEAYIDSCIGITIFTLMVIVAVETVIIANLLDRPKKKKD